MQAYWRTAKIFNAADGKIDRKGPRFAPCEQTLELDEDWSKGFDVTLDDPRHRKRWSLFTRRYDLEGHDPELDWAVRVQNPCAAMLTQRHLFYVQQENQPVFLRGGLPLLGLQLSVAVLLRTVQPIYSSFLRIWISAAAAHL